MRGAREAPAPRDSLNFRRASLLSRNECESGTFTIVLHATSSFTYVSVIYGANYPFNRVIYADKSEGEGFNRVIYIQLEALKIEEPDGLQERPSYHMHLTLHLRVGPKRFSYVSTHACLHLILKLHAKNVLQTFLGTLLRPQVYTIQVCYKIPPVCEFVRLRQSLHCTLEARKS